MPTISSRINHNLVIDQSGQVWGFGQNEFNQLGLSNHFNRNLPLFLLNLSSIKSVSTGTHHGLALNETGQVLSFGFGPSGQLGPGPNHRPIHYVIPNLPPMKEISAGVFHNLLLDMEGHVWSFGNNDYGQLGQGIIQDRQLLVPTIIPNLPPVKAISASAKHNLVLTVDGKVWAFGRNTKGQLGLSSDQSEYNTPTEIPNIPQIKAISTGYNLSLILDNQGRVWSFGLNDMGQLGLGDRNINRNTPTLIPNLPPIKAIAAGSFHCLALDENGQVWGWGSKSDGQLGPFNNPNRQLSPILIPDLPAMVEISVGLSHSLTLDSQGQVWAFGANDHGQCGIHNGFQKVSRPTQIPEIIAKLPEPTELSLSPFIKTSYPVITQLLDQMIDYRISPDQINDGTNDIFMEFEDDEGNVYLSRIQFDYQTEQIYPPTQSEPLFEMLTQFIQNGQLSDYQVHPDLYQDEQGNQGFEFLDTSGQRYLITVYLNQGEIYPPL